MSKATHFAGRPITLRTARSESAEAIIGAGNKPAVVEITNRQDKLFEVRHLTVKLTALADDCVCDPQPTVLDRFIKIAIQDYSKMERIASVENGPNLPPAAGVALRQITDSTFEWVPTEPITLMRGEGLQFNIVPRDQFVIAYHGERRQIDQIRVEIAAEGDSCYLGTAAHDSHGKKFEGEAPLQG